MNSRRRTSLALATCALLLAGVSGCASAGATSAGPSPLASGVLCAGSSGKPPGVTTTKVLVIVGENRSPIDLTDSAAPFQRLLGAQCDSLTNMHSETHPSESNYLALVSGGYPRWGLCDYPPDNDTPGCPYGPSGDLPGPSLFSQLEQAYGASGWRTYAESMGHSDPVGDYVPANCQRFDGVPYQTVDGKTHMKYGVRHNPAVFFSTLTSCAKYDIPMGDFTTEQGAFYDDARAGQLPRFSLVIPDDSQNGHDTSLRDFDDFLSATVGFLSQTTDYLTGRLVLIITYDEGSTGPGRPEVVGTDCADPLQGDSQPTCQIPTFVVGRYVTASQDSRFLTHYSILRTIQQWAGVPMLGQATTANSLAAQALLPPRTGTP